MTSVAPAAILSVRAPLTGGAAACPAAWPAVCVLCATAIGPIASVDVASATATHLRMNLSLTQRHPALAGGHLPADGLLRSTGRSSNTTCSMRFHRHGLSFAHHAGHSGLHHRRRSRMVGGED